MGQWESGAGAHALQDLSAHRSRPVNAKRPGVRNASSALAVHPTPSANSCRRSAFPAGSQTRLFTKLFSLLQIRFFGGKTAFTGSAQGFFRGQHPRFSACILYPRWAVPFSNLWFTSSMNTKLSIENTEKGLLRRGGRSWHGCPSARAVSRPVNPQSAIRN